MAKQHGAGTQTSNSDQRSASEGGAVLSPRAADDLLAIGGLSRPDVERQIAHAYVQQGYRIADAAGVGAHADGAILMLHGTQRVLLQCKHWKTRKIGEAPVREFYGVMAAIDAAAGILVTTGSITLEASRFAGFAGIQLLDVPHLVEVLRTPVARAATGQTGRHKMPPR